MDLKSLIAKMDQIESKQFLAESEKKDSSWTDMKGKKHTATQVKGKSYGNQPAPKEVDDEGKAKKKVKEGLGIAESLMEEFGLEEATNPWTGSDPAKAAAWDKLTPQDQQWIGGADPTDLAILRRAPNKGAAAPNVSPARPATTAPATTAPAATAPAATAPNVAPSQPKTATPAATAPAPAQQSTPKPTSNTSAKWPTTDAEIKAFQSANGLTADGLIGVKTVAALQKAGATPPAGFKPVTNRTPIGQSSQPSPAAIPQGSQSQVRAVDNDIDRKNAAASTNPQIAKIKAEIDRFQKSNNMNYQQNKDYVAAKQAQIDKMLGAGVAQAAPGAPDTSSAELARLQRLSGASTAPSFATDMAQRKAATAPAWSRTAS